MDQMFAILEKYNWPGRTLLAEIDFKEIEDQIAFNLPKDYKTFLTKYSGHEIEIGEEYIQLWDYEKIKPFNEGYEIFRSLPLTIGIGSNGGSEFIAIEALHDGSTRVILTPYIDLDRQYHIEIGKSFTDFLIRMEDGEKWFK